jgi:hypothetical protein
MRKIKHWLQRFRFELYFDIYLVRLQTVMLTRQYDRDAFTVCRMRVAFFNKTVVEFDLYRVPKGYRY